MVDRMIPIIPVPNVGDVVYIRPEWKYAFGRFDVKIPHRVVEVSPRTGGVKIEGDLNFRRLSCFESGGGPW